MPLPARSTVAAQLMPHPGTFLETVAVLGAIQACWYVPSLTTRSLLAVVTMDDHHFLSWATSCRSRLIFLPCHRVLQIAASMSVHSLGQCRCRRLVEKVGLQVCNLSDGTDEQQPFCSVRMLHSTPGLQAVAVCCTAVMRVCSFLDE